MTIGAFESLHCGHQAIIERVKNQAKHAGLASAVLMFEPLPGAFFANDKVSYRHIYRLSQRVRMIKKLNPDF